MLCMSPPSAPAMATIRKSCWSRVITSAAPKSWTDAEFAGAVVAGQAAINAYTSTTVAAARSNATKVVAGSPTKVRPTRESPLKAWGSSSP